MEAKPILIFYFGSIVLFVSIALMCLGGSCTGSAACSPDFRHGSSTFNVAMFSTFICWFRCRTRCRTRKQGAPVQLAHWCVVFHCFGSTLARMYACQIRMRTGTKCGDAYTEIDTCIPYTDVQAYTHTDTHTHIRAHLCVLSTLSYPFGHLSIYLSIRLSIYCICITGTCKCIFRCICISI